MKKYPFLAALVAVLLCGCSSNEPELHVYTWANFIKPELYEQFEKEHGCRVVINTFDSNEAMYAKLNLGATGYDVLFPSNYYADLLQKQGMLQQIDLALVPNAKYADPKYVSMLDESSVPYALPFTVTSTAIGYRKDRVDIKDPSWGVFADSTHKGRMTMLNDPREALGAALKFLGYSLNTTDEKQVKEAEAILIGWKRNLAKFESEQYKNGLASAEYLIVQGFGGEIQLVHQENSNVVCVLPKEGTILSIDLLTIARDSQNKELAHAFVNFLLEPKNAVETVEYTRFLVPNTAAYALMPAKYKEDPLFFPPQAIAEKSELIKDLGKATELYNHAWDRVKAAE